MALTGIGRVSGLVCWSALVLVLLPGAAQADELRMPALLIPAAPGSLPAIEPAAVAQPAVAVPAVADTESSATDASALAPESSESPSSESSSSESPSAEAVERSREAVAGYLDALSGDLDSFFVDAFFNEDIIENDVRGSRAVLSSYSRRKIGEPVDYRFGLSVKLVFPHTNERLNLLLQSEEEEKRESNPLESVENNNYTAALRFIIREGEQWKTDIDTGIRWGLPPDPFSRFRARRYISLPGWDIRATQTLFYYTTDGWGEDSAVQMDHPIADSKLLRLNAKAGYLLNDDYFKLSYSAALYHELSNRAAIGFISGASGDTRVDATFNSYSASVRYRRQVYSDWVFAEVAPELVWEAAHEYQTVPALMLRLEAVIGR